MKLSILACAISVVMVTASPGAVSHRRDLSSLSKLIHILQSSLKRGFKMINVAGEVNPVQVTCYECPCDVSFQVSNCALRMMLTAL